ncbi:hypothetical protein Gotri_021003, partial [Gossypium trilobum]|nr:hypothetical protein [Gossypium trilobum]
MACLLQAYSADPLKQMFGSTEYPITGVFHSGLNCVPSGGIKLAWDERESNNQSAWEGAEWALAGSACERE